MEAPLSVLGDRADADALRGGRAHVPGPAAGAGGTGATGGADEVGMSLGASSEAGGASAGGATAGAAGTAGALNEHWAALSQLT
jgi:hypothetical protein